MNVEMPIIDQTLMEDDMPIGIQFIANAFDEMNLLQVAYTFEQNTPYHNEVPTMRGGKN